MSTARPVTPLGLVTAELEWLAGRLRDDPTDPHLVDSAERALALAGGLDAYVARCSTPESPALAALARRTADEDWSGGPRLLEREMLSGHVEGQVLQMLVRATGARRVLEIGMFTGYSALAMAEGLPDGGTVVACEVDERPARVARECFAASPVGDRITVRLGPALETMAALAAEGAVFDLVFVDADKPGYPAYVDGLLDLGLLAPGALVCVDNTLLQGEPWLPEQPSANGAAVADFNRAVADDPRWRQVVLPLRDGLTLLQRVER